MHNATGLSGSFGPMHEINETDQINEIDQLRSARPASLARLSSGSVPCCGRMCGPLGFSRTNIVFPQARAMRVLKQSLPSPARPRHAATDLS